MIRKPEWLRKKFEVNSNSAMVEGMLSELGLNTICNEALCPNRHECFNAKTATFLIMGSVCTRNCSFCNVKNGKPRSIDPDEPSKIAEAVTRLGLRYVVVTSVTRDDIPDGGAYHFAEVIRSVNDANPETAVEVLIPDFRGSTDSLKKVLDANPTVVSHNVETVEELYGYVRPEADYRRSLDLIRNIRKINPRVHSKTGIMLGLGETFTQLLKTFDDLITVNCEILTIGQYLSPSEDHYPVKEYIHPDVFIEYGEIARKKGFDFVASSPFVRSSYQAAKAIVTFSTL